MILITGYGFLGKSLASYFDQELIDYRVADRNAGYLSNSHSVYFDLNNTSTYNDILQGIDTIIHLIHPTVPANSANSPRVDLVSNVEAHEKFLDYISGSSVKKIIYISTGGAIYGHPEYLPVDEQHPCFPVSNYGKGKLLLEQLFQEKCKAYNIDLKIIRPSNIYGLFQKTDKPQGVIAHIADAILHDKKFTIWGKGINRKDYLYIKDFTAAIGLLISNSKKTDTIYNLSSGHSNSILELIEKTEGLVHKKLHTVFIEEMNFDVKNILLNCEKFKKDFNWEAKYNTDEGLRDLLSSITSA
jgi:UDP-glucose 4-epimerase